MNDNYADGYSIADAANFLIHAMSDNSMLARAEVETAKAIIVTKYYQIRSDLNLTVESDAVRREDEKEKEMAVIMRHYMPLSTPERTLWLAVEEIAKSHTKLQSLSLLYLIRAYNHVNDWLEGR